MLFILCSDAVNEGHQPVKKKAATTSIISLLQTRPDLCSRSLTQKWTMLEAHALDGCTGTAFVPIPNHPHGYYPHPYPY